LKNRFGEDGIKIPIHFDTTKIDIRSIEDSGKSGINKMAHQIEANVLQQDEGLDGL
jgi:hypothetical protein